MWKDAKGQSCKPKGANYRAAYGRVQKVKPANSKAVDGAACYSYWLRAGMARKNLEKF